MILYSRLKCTGPILEETPIGIIPEPSEDTVVSDGFIVSPISGKIKTDFQSEELKFFKKIPKNTVPHHKKMIKDEGGFIP